MLTDKNISIYERERKCQQLYNDSFDLKMNGRYLYKIFNENSKNIFGVVSENAKKLGIYKGGLLNHNV